MTTRLTYFDSDFSRGLECRLALSLAGIPFEDDRVPSAEWPARKPNTPFGSLPVLTVDGRQIAQANAILGYAGRIGAIHPTDPWEAARHESILLSVEDVRHKLPPKGATEEATRTAREAFAAGWLTRWATTVEAEVAGPFVAGDRPNVVDIKLYVILGSLTGGTFDHIPTTLLDGFPKLRALRAAVDALPAVRGWFARRAAATA
jgi:glutathione S-transferase